MNTTIFILTVGVSFGVAGCASDQTRTGQDTHDGGTVENEKEKSFSSPISRFNMQIGTPECGVR